MAGLTGLVVIDEIQREPALFETLRVLADRPDNPARFLMLGERIAGADRRNLGVPCRARRDCQSGGFDLSEVDPDSGAPSGSVAASRVHTSHRTTAPPRCGGEASFRRFFERDIPQLGITVPAETLRRFWTMLAHYHGQVWNAAEFARALGSSEGTARRYFDILTGAFMIRALPPWFANIRKRQVRSPRIYVRDTGLLHTLLTVDTGDEVAGHPKVGASFEGFAVEQVAGVFGTSEVYFWATHGGAELDLLVMRGGKRYGFECSSPTLPALRAPCE